MPSKTKLFLLDCPPKLYLWQLTGTYWSSGCWFTWIPAFRLYLLSFVAIYIFLWIWYACFNVMTLSCKCIHTGVGRVDDNLHKPLKFYCFCPKSAFNTHFCCYSRSFICTSETRFSSDLSSFLSAWRFLGPIFWWLAATAWLWWLLLVLDWWPAASVLMSIVGPLWQCENTQVTVRIHAEWMQETHRMHQGLRPGVWTLGGWSAGLWQKIESPQATDKQTERGSFYYNKIANTGKQKMLSIVFTSAPSCSFNFTWANLILHMTPSMKERRTFFK